MTAAPVQLRSKRRAKPIVRGTTLPKERLRLWLRLLRSSRGIEAELRERLRLRYKLTLPQFDVLAALARRPDGITMTELSRYLMVSNGNVTGIVDRLVADGHVERSAAPGDRRATVVALTPAGRASFAAMATEHETWVDGLLEMYDADDVADLIGHLDTLVARLRPSVDIARTSASKELPAQAARKGAKAR